MLLPERVHFAAHTLLAKADTGGGHDFIAWDDIKSNLSKALGLIFFLLAVKAGFAHQGRQRGQMMGYLSGAFLCACIAWLPWDKIAHTASTYINFG